MTKTMNASDTVLTVRIYAYDDVSTTVWDGAQLEQKSSATPYADGSLGPGYSWSGTSHGSTSSRTAGSIFTYYTINSANGIGAVGRSTAPALRIEQDGTGPIASFFDTATEVFRIADGGNVGIGTTAPATTLDVVGNFRANSSTFSPSSSETGVNINNPVDEDGFTTVDGAIKITAATTYNGTNYSNLYMKYAVDHTTFFMQTKDTTTYARNISLQPIAGNVGIGTFAPNYALDVRGSETSNYVAQIYNTSTATGADGLLVNLGIANASRTTSNYFIGFAGAGTVAGKIQGGASAVAYTTTGADYAEYFLIGDLGNKPEVGDLVAIDPSHERSVVKATPSTSFVGVVSNMAGFIGNGPICQIGDDNCDQNYGQTNVVVGITGQVNLKVSTVNGTIIPGDALTASTTPGVAMKATQTGQILGHALTSYSDPDPNNAGTIVANINPSWNNDQFNNQQLVLNNSFTNDIAIISATLDSQQSAINNLSSDVSSLITNYQLLTTNFSTGSLSIGIGTTSPANKLEVIGSCLTGDTLLPIRRKKKRRKSDKNTEGGDDDPHKNGYMDKWLNGCGETNHEEYAYDYLYCRIDEILPGDEVLSLNESTGRVEWHVINALMDMGVQEIFELKTKSGRVIRTTAKHPYLIKLLNG